MEKKNYNFLVRVKDENEMKSLSGDIRAIRGVLHLRTVDILKAGIAVLMPEAKKEMKQL